MSFLPFLFTYTYKLRHIKIDTFDDKQEVILFFTNPYIKNASIPPTAESQYRFSDTVMNTGTAFWILIAFHSIFNFECCYSHDRPKIVTYGDPCIATRQLPIKIEGPKPPVEDEKIPVSLNFRVVSDMYVQPRRDEYSITIDVPSTSIKSQSDSVIIDDTSRGTFYTYNTHVPPAVEAPPASKHYNFVIDETVRNIDIPQGNEQSEGMFYQRLKGLRTRIDTVLVPACEVQTSYEC
ncbi:uncharacterized protein LOC128873396 [Hylaeus volcanicus]|uniref:uncharacterized protein LOC128873396 n=1 Tax=Hylaeus volcanicus TaxID=313075 RepID=UPI0023B7A710|nr:uncharacterized protein LOC128873396 [Hylaeus volcanicus]